MAGQGLVGNEFDAIAKQLLQEIQEAKQSGIPPEDDYIADRQYQLQSLQKMQQGNTQAPSQMPRNMQLSTPIFEDDRSQQVSSMKQREGEIAEGTTSPLRRGGPGAFGSPDPMAPDGPRTKHAVEMDMAWDDHPAQSGNPADGGFENPVVPSPGGDGWYRDRTQQIMSRIGPERLAQMPANEAMTTVGMTEVSPELVRFWDQLPTEGRIDAVKLRSEFFTSSDEHIMQVLKDKYGDPMMDEEMQGLKPTPENPG